MKNIKISVMLLVVTFVSGNKAAEGWDPSCYDAAMPSVSSRPLSITSVKEKFDELFSSYPRKEGSVSSQKITEIETIIKSLTHVLKQMCYLKSLIGPQRKYIDGLINEFNASMNRIQKTITDGKARKSFTHKRSSENIKIIDEEIKKLNEYKNIIKASIDFIANSEKIAIGEELKSFFEQVRAIQRRKKSNQEELVIIERLASKLLASAWICDSHRVIEEYLQSVRGLMPVPSSVRDCSQQQQEELYLFDNPRLKGDIVPVLPSSPKRSPRVQAVKTLLYLDQSNT